MRKTGIALLLAVAVLALLLSREWGGGPSAPSAEPNPVGSAAPASAESEAPNSEAAEWEPGDEGNAGATGTIDPRQTGRLRILVTGGNGPVPSARVEVRPATGPSWLLPTDESGMAFLDAVPAGRCEIRIEAQEFAPDHSSISIPLGGLAIRQVGLRPPRVLSGTVVKPDGSPVPGARVRLFQWGGAYLDGEAWESLRDPLGETVTGADGRFRAEGLRGSYLDQALFLVSADGFRTTLYFGKDGIRIPIAPGSDVEGRVADEDGRPIAGVRVVAVPATHRALWGEDVAVRRSTRDRQEEALAPVVARTDAAGRYRLPGLGWSEPYVVRFFAEGFSFRQRGVKLPAGPLNMTLSPGGSVHATVRDADGRPVAGARVHVTGPWTRWFPGGETGVDGRVTVGGLPPGRLKVRGSAGGARYADVRVNLPNSGDADAEIVLPSDTHRPPAGAATASGDETLSGRVVFPDGEPVSRGFVKVSPSRHRTMIETDGHFRIDFLPPGEIRVTADPYGGENAVVTATVPGPPLRIVVPRRPAVAGRLILPPGAVAPRLVSVRWQGRSTSFHWRSDSDGACPFSLDAKPGPCPMEFRVDGFRPLEYKGEVPKGGTGRTGNLTLDAGRVLTGRVVTGDGVGVADAEVGRGKPGRATHRVRTGPDGGFRLGGLGTEPTPLSVVADGFLGIERTIPADAPRVELVLSRGVLVEVSVTTEDGDPIRGAEVELRPIDREQKLRTAVTESIGLASFRVAPGSHQVTAVVKSLIPGEEGRTATQSIQLEAARPRLRLTLVPR